jgi:hypothetical protein
MMEIPREEVSQRLVIESFNNIIERVPDEAFVHFDKLLESYDEQLEDADDNNNSNMVVDNKRLQNFISFFFLF